MDAALEDGIMAKEAKEGLRVRLPETFVKKPLVTLVPVDCVPLFVP